MKNDEQEYSEIIADEVLPCPFCGSMPVLMTCGEHQSNMCCPECGAKLPAISGTNKDADALKAWNRRVLSMREKDMYEALKSAMWELYCSARGYSNRAITEACHIRDLLLRIDIDTSEYMSYDDKGSEQI